MIASRCNLPALDRLQELQSALMVEVQAQQSWDDAVEQLAQDAESAAESGADLAARLDLATRWFSLAWISCTPAWIAKNCRASVALTEPVLAPPAELVDQVVAVRRARTEGLKHLTQLQRPVAIEPVIPDDVEIEPSEPSDEVERARLARLARIRRRPAPAPAEDLQPAAKERQREAGGDRGNQFTGGKPAVPADLRESANSPQPSTGQKAVIALQVREAIPEPPDDRKSAAPDPTCWFTVAEAADFLGLGIRAVQRRRQLGLFGVEGCGWFRRGRSCYISPEAVERQAKKTPRPKPGGVLRSLPGPG